MKQISTFSDCKTSKELIEQLTMAGSEATKETREALRQLEQGLSRGKDSARTKAIEYIATVSDSEVLGAYAVLLSQNQENPLPYHFIGKSMLKHNLFLPASILFHRGLELDSPDSKNASGEFFHQRFHFDIHDLLGDLEDKNQNPEEFNVPLSRIQFKYSNERGFYLPCLENERAISRTKEKALKDAHYKIGIKPHTAKNCAYLDSLK